VTLLTARLSGNQHISFWLEKQRKKASSLRLSLDI